MAKSSTPNLDAARTGDRRKALVELRDTLALRLDTTDKDIHAQIAAQYRETLRELEAISEGEKTGGTVDDLKSRREAHKGRRAAADASSNP